MLIETFLGTRWYDFTKGKAQAPGVDTQQVVLPLIELFNHHWQSFGFQSLNRDKEWAPCVSVVNAKPVPGSDECFVLYNLFDALDAYLLYDFVDESTCVVRSVPLRLPVFDGYEIEVLAGIYMPRKRSDLPDQLRDLQIYLPKPLEKTGKYLRVSNLLIPDFRAPLALRRVLAFLVQHMVRKITPQRLESLVLEMEHAVITKNVEFYRGLRSSIDSLSASGTPAAGEPQLARLIEFQLAKLNAYADRHQLAI